MEYVVSLIGWQLWFGLNLCLQKKDNPALKLPSMDELKQMKKEVLRRFRQRLKMTHYNRNLRDFNAKGYDTIKAG
ncbi:hypothetical protein ES703_32933 [subsurface metagenome]